MPIGTTVNKKKNSTGRGKDRPRGIILRRGQVDPGRETPRTPALDLGSGATFLGPLPNGPGPSWQLTTFLRPLPTGPGPGWLHSPSHQEHSEEGFFQQAGEIRPGGGSNPPPAGAAGCAQTDWANNLRPYGFPFIYSQHISMPYSSLCSLICLKHWVVLAHCYSPSFSSFCLFWAAGMWLDYNIRWLYTFKHHIVWPQHAPQLGFSSP